MKIAIPTRQGFVDDNLSFCETYTIYTIGENFEVESQETFQPDGGCCSRLNAAAILRQQGVSVILAGNVEPMVLNKMLGHGLEIVRNCHGVADNVVKNYLQKLIEGPCEYCRQNEKWDHQNN